MNDPSSAPQRVGIVDQLRAEHPAWTIGYGGQEVASGPPVIWLVAQREQHRLTALTPIGLRTKLGAWEGPELP